MKGDDIAERLMDLAVAIVQLVTALPRRNPIARHIGGQVVRAGTSGGAHYEEALEHCGVQ